MILVLDVKLDVVVFWIFFANMELVHSQQEIIQNNNFFVQKRNFPPGFGRKFFLNFGSQNHHPAKAQLLRIGEGRADCKKNFPSLNSETFGGRGHEASINGYLSSLKGEWFPPL